MDPTSIMDSKTRPTFQLQSITRHPYHALLHLPPTGSSPRRSLLQAFRGCREVYLHKSWYPRRHINHRLRIPLHRSLEPTRRQYIYRQLYHILLGLESFVIGQWLLPHLQNLQLDIVVHGLGKVGTGVIHYTPPSEQPASPIPYPVPSTPITLSFASLLPIPIPANRASKLLNNAQASVKGNADASPNAPITGADFFSYTDNYGPKAESASVIIHREPRGIVTRLQLYEILEALEDFMLGRSLGVTHLQILVLRWRLRELV